MIFREYKEMWGPLKAGAITHKIASGGVVRFPITETVSVEAVVTSVIRNRDKNEQITGYLLDGSNWYNLTMLVKFDGSGSYMLAPRNTPSMNLNYVVEYYEKTIQRDLAEAGQNLV